jgi:hypothetical protein
MFRTSGALFLRCIAAPALMGWAKSRRASSALNLETLRFRIGFGYGYPENRVLRKSFFLP